MWLALQQALIKVFSTLRVTDSILQFSPPTSASAEKTLENQE